MYAEVRVCFYKLFYRLLIHAHPSSLASTLLPFPPPLSSTHPSQLHFFETPEKGAVSRRPRRSGFLHVHRRRIWYVTNADLFFSAGKSTFLTLTSPLAFLLFSKLPFPQHPAAYHNNSRFPDHRPCHEGRPQRLNVLQKEHFLLLQAPVTILGCFGPSAPARSIAHRGENGGVVPLNVDICNSCEWPSAVGCPQSLESLSQLIACHTYEL